MNKNRSSTRQKHHSDHANMNKRRRTRSTSSSTRGRTRTYNSQVIDFDTSISNTNIRKKHDQNKELDLDQDDDRSISIVEAREVKLLYRKVCEYTYWCESSESATTTSSPHSYKGKYCAAYTYSPPTEITESTTTASTSSSASANNNQTQYENHPRDRTTSIKLLYRQIKQMIEANKALLSTPIPFDPDALDPTNSTDTNDMARYISSHIHDELTDALRMIKVVPLCWVCHIGNAAMTKLFLKRCPDMVNYTTDMPRYCPKKCVMPLHLAAMSFSREAHICVQLLLERAKGNTKIHMRGLAAIKDPRGDLPLHKAARFTNPQSVRLLLEAYPGGARRRNKMGVYPIQTVPTYNSNRSQLCLDEGGEADHVKCARLLLQVFPEGQENQSLMSDLEDDYVYDFAFQSQDLPVHKAAAEDDLAMVRLLISFKREIVTAAGYHGKTPLHKAAFHGSWRCVTEFLCKYHDTVHIQDEKGNLPIHDAVTSAFISRDCIEKLLDASPESLLVPNQQGNLPIHLALQNSHCPTSVICLLLDVCIPAVSTPNKAGVLPIDLAIDRASEDPQSVDLVQYVLLETNYSCLFEGTRGHRSKVDEVVDLST